MADMRIAKAAAFEPGGAAVDVAEAVGATGGLVDVAGREGGAVATFATAARGGLAAESLAITGTVCQRLRRPGQEGASGTQH